MTTTAKNFAAKAFVAVVAGAMVFSLIAPAAKADVASDLQAQITALMAQIAALQGGGTPGATAMGSYTFTRSLTIGSTGADVTALQNYLLSKSFAIPAGATGYFGAQTQAAVAAWQTANGVMPAAGYFGPVSQAKYMALMAAMPPVVVPPVTGTTTTPTTPGVTLGNGEGDLKNFDEVSSADANINEGQTGEVFAFTAEVEGDVEVDRVDFYLDADNNTASDNANDYFQNAMLMVDGKEVATLDVSDFEEDTYNKVSGSGTGDEYRLRFTGLGLVFADGDNPEFTLAFEVNPSIDSGDLAAANFRAVLETDSVRFTDGKGYTDSVGAALFEEFGFDAEEAADLEITLSDDTPDAKTIGVEETDQSKELDILVVSVEETNGVAVTINDMTFQATTTGSTTDESTVIAEAKLYNGSTLLGSESVANGGEIKFENLDLQLDADETVDLKLKMVFNASEDYVEGQQVIAAFVSVDAAKDDNGNDEGDMTITTDQIEGNLQTLRSTGVSITFLSDSSDQGFETKANDTTNANDDQGVFTYKFEVTAFGDDFFFNKTAARGTTGTTEGAEYLMTTSGGTLTASGTASESLTSSAATVGSRYKVTKNTTETFTLKVTYDPATTGFYGLRLNNVNYFTLATGGVLASENATPAGDYDSEENDI